MFEVVGAFVSVLGGQGRLLPAMYPRRDGSVPRREGVLGGFFHLSIEERSWQAFGRSRAKCARTNPARLPRRPLGFSLAGLTHRDCWRQKNP